MKRITNIFQIVLICSLFILIANFDPQAQASSAPRFTIRVVYGEIIHQYNTGESLVKTLTDTNNTSLDISLPSGILSEATDVQLTMYSLPEWDVIREAPLPSAKVAADTFYNLSLMKVADSAIIDSFSKSITLTFHYTDSDITGIQESTLKAYRWNGSNWILLTSDVDASQNIVTATTDQFNFFALLGTAPASSGGTNGGGGTSGGGGGTSGGGSPTSGVTTSVIFNGRAYPKSTVTLLKDAQVAATAIAGSDSNFEIDLSGIGGGNYIFSLYSEDYQGIRSALLTFPVSITRGATTQVSDIFIAPTIEVDKSEVKRGDNLAIFGQSMQAGEITFVIHSPEEIFFKTRADKNGVYLYNFNTASLEYGYHFTKAKAARDGLISSFSKAVGFQVGTKTIRKEVIKALKGDFNGDGRVNLVDFSIAAYWYQRLSPPAKVDLNSDGKVNLVDLSIMAFYWTG